MTLTEARDRHLLFADLFIGNGSFTYKNLNVSIIIFSQPAFVKHKQKPWLQINANKPTEEQAAT